MVSRFIGTSAGLNPEPPRWGGEEGERIQVKSNI